MGKLEYLDALKRALAGLPPQLQAKTLAYYEQRFVDGSVLGRTDSDIARELGDPKKIAMSLRANAYLSGFAQKRQPANLLRRLVSALGLSIVNLVMVVPAIVYAVLLAAMYACALSFYVAGIAITASGLSGANELVLGAPLRHVLSNHDDTARSTAQTRVRIDDDGIHIVEHTLAAAAIARAEAVAGHGLRIATGMDIGARTTQALFGLAMVVAAIVLFLLSLVVTKYTIIAIKRYIAMNFSLLQGS